MIADRPAHLKVVLFSFSEWLDSEGLIVSDDGDDKRSHEQLVNDFIASLG